MKKEIRKLRRKKIKEHKRKKTKKEEDLDRELWESGAYQDNEDVEEEDL